MLASRMCSLLIYVLNFNIDIDIDVDIDIDIEYEQQHAEKKWPALKASHSQSLQCLEDSAS